MQKLYCYVDESGLDTEGQLFIVACVVPSDNRDAVLSLCESFEKVSGKNKLKWGKAEHKARMEYLRQVFANAALKGRLCYAIFRQTSDYDTATIEAIVLGIRYFVTTEDYTSMIFVDALSKTKRHEYGARIRKLGVRTHKVQGVTKDESNALVRLADAIAGFVRDAVEGREKEIADLFQKAIADGALIEVSK